MSTLWNPAATEQQLIGGASEGNRLTLFLDGDEAFEVAYEAIRAAQQRVWLEMYILEPDAVGSAAIEAMTEAAARGCDVILLFDRFGSPRIRARHTAPIWKAGGRVVMYNPLFPWRKAGRRVGSFFHRDHRKILIVDEEAFCGGRNLTVDYGGPGPERFLDLTLRVEGPAVRDLASVLLDSLFNATHEKLPLPPRTSGIEHGVEVDVLELNARNQERDLEQGIYELLEQAQHRCRLSTPYFIPPRWFRESLIRAIHRGVSMQILTAGESDVPHARLAGRHLYGSILAAGGRIFEMQQPLLHAKYLTIDGKNSILGSYNVDQYGSRHNLEVGVAVRDSAFAHHLETTFDGSLPYAVEVTMTTWKERPWYERSISRMLYQLAQL